jgi:hypothetical protein
VSKRGRCNISAGCLCCHQTKPPSPKRDSLILMLISICPVLYATGRAAPQRLQV